MAKNASLLNVGYFDAKLCLFVTILIINSILSIFENLLNDNPSAHINHVVWEVPVCFMRIIPVIT